MFEKLRAEFIETYYTTATKQLIKPQTNHNFREQNQAIGTLKHENYDFYISFGLRKLSLIVSLGQANISMIVR